MKSSLSAFLIEEMRGVGHRWLREPDLNRRPSGYEPDELPDCSIPRLIERTIPWIIFVASAFSI